MIRYEVEPKTGHVHQKTFHVDLDGKVMVDEKGQPLLAGAMVVMKHPSGGTYPVGLNSVETYKAKGDHPASMADVKAAFVAAKVSKDGVEEKAAAEDFEKLHGKAQSKAGAPSSAK